MPSKDSGGFEGARRRVGSGGHHLGKNQEYRDGKDLSVVIWVRQPSEKSHRRK